MKRAWIAGIVVVVALAWAQAGLMIRDAGAWEPTPRAAAALAGEPRLAMGAVVLRGVGSRPEGDTTGYWLTEAEIDSFHARSLDTYITIGGATSVLAFTERTPDGGHRPILVLANDGGVYWNGARVISDTTLVAALRDAVALRRAELCGEAPR